MATRMERFDEFKILAESNIVERRDAAVVYATLAQATAMVRVGDFLERIANVLEAAEEDFLADQAKKEGGQCTENVG